MIFVTKIILLKMLMEFLVRGRQQFMFLMNNNGST